MKRRGFARILACLLVIVIYISAAAFSLRGESLVTPGNPIEDLKEEADGNTASMLSSYLPKSQEIVEEMGLEDEEESQDSEDTAQEAEDNSDSESLSDEMEGTQQGDSDGGGADEAGDGNHGGNGTGGSGGNGPSGGSRGEGVEKDEGNAQNYFTTSIIDGETVTTPSYAFTITQLQKEIPLVETKVYVNKQDVGQFNGKVGLSEGKNGIKVTCSYKKEGKKKFSVSRSYTVILDTTDIVFFTNLEDGITVSRTDFSFTAYAQYRGEDVPLTVKVNDAVCEKIPGEGHDYEVTLKRQSNTVVFEAKTEGGKTQTKRYTIHVKLKEATILTDLGRLAETEAADPKLEFYASVLETDMGTEHPAKVTMNGTELESSDFNYRVTLNEGENTFTVDGTSVNRDIAVETYVIYYYAPAAGLEIRTDLEPEMKVSDPSFEFYAYARDSQSIVKLDVTVNGQPAEANKNHYYSVGLQTNDNSIVLTADNGVDRKVQEYIVTYEPQNASNPVEEDNPQPPEEEDEYAPSITSPDLYDGMTVKGSTLVFTIKAVDYHGTKLSSGYLTLKLNGYSSGITLVWDDSSKTSYRLKLKTGENELSIRVTDQEGHSKTFLLHIISEAVAEGTPIGRARFSIDASVLGMGFLVPPTDVDLYDGENIAYVLDRFLKENGFTYNFTGSLSRGFYLSRINKKGLLKGLDSSMKEQYAGSYSDDGLGEFDFTTGSGWMYSVNGDFPNYGFSDCYPQNGAELRIQFTLNYGDDIGGGGALGG